MKKTAILSFLFFAALAFAQGIKFEEGSNFKTILAKAKKKTNLFLLMLMQFGVDHVN